MTLSSSRVGANGHTHRVGDALYIFLAGSDHWLDWLRNFDPRTIRVCSLRLQRSWAQMAVGVRSQLDLAGVERVIVECFSMGGAVAQIVGWMLQADYRVEVITHAAPAAGNRALYKDINEVTTRYVAPWDVVTWLPPWWKRPGRLVRVQGRGHSWAAYEKNMLLTPERVRAYMEAT